MFSNFSQKTLVIVVGIVASSLMGLVFIQVQWLRSAIEVSEQRFNDHVCTAIHEVQDNYGENLGFILNNAAWSSRLNEVKLLLADEFAQRNLPTEFEIALTDHNHHNSIDMGNKIFAGNESAVTLPFLCSYSISVYFPGKDTFVLTQLTSTLAPSIIFIILLISCFAYVIVTLKRQKRISEIKNDFINNLTHEFQTPLSSIGLTNRMIQQRCPDRFDEKDRQYFAIVESETSRLRGQIDKVLQMAQLDAGVFALEKKDLDIHELIGKVTRNFDAIVKETSGSISLELNATRTVMSGDECHITNVIYNLIDNACKYSQGKPEIRIATMNVKEGLCISVKDHGIGIGQKVQRHIFEKFYRVPTGNLHNVKGFGLGLSYVKSIVNAHKGKVSIRSEVNKGSEFQVILPSL